MKEAALNSIRKAEELKIQLGISMSQLPDIHNICSTLNLPVFYTDINMEGMYIQGAQNAILLSNKRPFGRRVFTCAHELGHHVFKHGSRLDTIEGTLDYNEQQLKEEFQVNTFAGALLMPLIRLEKEIRIRKISLNNCTPFDIFKLSSIFGVGYSTIITHCFINKMINGVKAKELNKVHPGRIFKVLFPEIKYKNGFKILDRLSNLKFIEIEEGQLLILPSNNIECNLLTRCLGHCEKGHVYRAISSGIRNINLNNNKTELRVQVKDYSGLSENRFKRQEKYANISN